ncbi:MAG: chromosomal replication initiator protein DnaA [Lachnospiraceae bacterium]|nr:chromosomal replication initiator protein DnaA [Lachnospiraceae bacterium]
MTFIEKNWDQILEKVKEDYDITNVAFNTWLKPLKIYSVEDNKITLLVTNESIAVTLIRKKYALPLQVVIEEMTGVPYEIDFVMQGQVPQKKAAPLPMNNRKNESRKDENYSNLNPNYTFDSFVVGNNNRFAHSASLAVAEQPGEIYNPLFLYGGVGLGKTHLMHSIAHYIQETMPDLKVLYVTSETFTNEVIDGIRNGTMQKLREKYRNTDVLLVDDVQFIIGKESTQEEFFHTFNELHVAKKQIIISSDRPPKEMVTLEERIRSRFEWGLTADIGSPDYETRMAILRKKIEQDNFYMDDEILNYIAVNLKSNIRELEGALNKLLAYSNLEQKEITMEIAQKELENLINPDTKKEVTPQLIMEVVAEHFSITVDQLMSKSRTKDIALPRQIVMYLCKNMTSLPLESIGRLIGGRDHSTILHGVNKVKDEFDKDKDFRQTVETIQKKINPNY